jgi:hypothetical protein
LWEREGSFACAGGVTLIGALVLAASLNDAVAAADAPPVIDAVRLGAEERLDIDGCLTEPAWNRAPAASGFRQREPQEGAPATEQTEVRVLYDGTTLYVGVLAHDREPDKVIAHVLRRDKIMEAQGTDGSFDFAGDDGVAILFDPFHDRRNAVVFATNPNGAEFDALITDESASYNVDWRSVWRVAACRRGDGWSAEFAIPFRSLRYPTSASGEPWGFNVYRTIRRKNEQTLWSGWLREGGGFHRVSRAGTLSGLEDLPRSRLNLEVKPYVLGGRTAERATGGNNITASDQWSAGLDAKWEVQPGLVLDGTVKPDFAQVEADDQQINLTRFSLFFPEKRDFFLENAGIFDFGVRGAGEPPPLLLFFSRTIGIVGEDSVPVLGGIRLSGRAGHQTVGFLDTYTDAGSGQPRTNFGVARWKRDVGGSNYIGAIVTDRRANGHANTTFGADASFWPRPGLNLTAFVAKSETKGAGGDGAAYRLSADYTGDRYGFVLERFAIDPDMEADMGFIARNDIRRDTIAGRVTFRPEILGLRKINVYGGATLTNHRDGSPQDDFYQPNVLFEWNSGETVNAFWGTGTTRLDSPFILSDRVPVPKGKYHTDRYGISASTSRHRQVYFNASATLLDNYGGPLNTYAVNMGINTGSHLLLTVGETHNHVDLPGGHFDANLASLRLGWSFSTHLAVNALVQYNSLTKKLLTNLRLNFIHRPGSDLYVVFNEDRGDGISLRPVAYRGTAIKLTYLARF